MKLPPGVTISENAWLARLAAWYMRSNAVAMVIGNRILLWGVTAHDFQQNKCWVRHELKHVEQYSQYGIPRFLVLYLLESMKKGYRKNQFEVEARNAEETPHPIAG